MDFWEAYAKRVVPALQSLEQFEVAARVNLLHQYTGRILEKENSYTPCIMNCTISFDLYGLPVSQACPQSPNFSLTLNASVNRSRRFHP